MRYDMPAPPTLIGSEAEQLVQMHRYLFRMNEMLNQAIASGEVQLQAVSAQQAAQGSANEGISKDLVGQYNQAKALIIKTAHTVRSEMDRIVQELDSKYLAISEWGTFEENIKQEIETTATGIVQSFDYDSKLDAIGTDFENWVIESKGYIQSGIIGFDEKNLPIYGIAVGQDLANVTVTMDDGTELETIDMTRNLATYTSDRIDFWQNGVSVAYISNGEMMINQIKTIEGMRFEDEWEVSRMRGGFGIRWIGGEVEDE